MRTKRFMTKEEYVICENFLFLISNYCKEVDCDDCEISCCCPAQTSDMDFLHEFLGLFEIEKE